MIEVREPVPFPRQHRHGRAVAVVVVPAAALAWASLAVLGLAVRLALLRTNRGQGTTAILWGLGFALFIWAGARVLKLADIRAIPLAMVAGAAIALFTYLRGSALENPPEGQPGAYQARLLTRWRKALASDVPYQRYTGETRELAQARVELGQGELTAALYSLREADRVAVAQRKPDELLKVQQLTRSLADISSGHTRSASLRLSRRITEQLHGFPPEALASASVDADGRRRRASYPRATSLLPADDTTHPTSRELSEARLALEDGELKTALYALREGRRVAVAQRKLDLLLEVRELVRLLYQQSSGRTRQASDRLADRVEQDLISFG